MKITGEQVLLSVGRKVNVAGIGLENIGVEFTPKGVKIDQNCRTNVPNVYAAETSLDSRCWRTLPVAKEKWP